MSAHDDTRVDVSSDWQDIEHWFHEALAWPSDERQDRLRQHDVAPAVVAEVLSLLEAAETPEGFSETSPHVVALDWTEQQETPASGKRITTYCDKHRFDLRRRLEVFVEVCGVVRRAHDTGILHPDLRPSNIRLSGNPAEPQLEVLSLNGSGVPEAQDAVGHGPLKQGGHPDYKSPETLARGSAALDTRSNVYSLGVLLWELMVGLRPFSGGQLLHLVDRSTDATLLVPPSLRFQRIARGPREVIAEIRQQDSRGLLRELRPDLDWIALQATRLDPTQRYASVAELMTDLEAWLDGRGVPSRPAGLWERLGAALRRQLPGKR